MKPQNTKERNVAFIKFIFLFVITTGLIVLAVFFGYRTPYKENTYLLEKIKTMERQIADERQFANRIENIKKLIDSLDMPNVNADYLQQLIGTYLADIQNSIPQDDTTFRKKMYSNTIQSYLELKTTKHALIKMKDVKLTMEECSELLDKFKSDLEQSQRDLDICRQLSRK